MWRREFARHSAMLAVAAIVVAMVAAPASSDDSDSILKKLKNINVITATVPGNGDINPYGIVQVKHTVGKLLRGHILISNFNNMANQQGTGTTIVDVAPDGTLSTFAQIDPTKLPGPCPGGVGLTTALTVLRTGWVIVGSLPTTDGTSATAQSGCLLVLDNSGNVVETLTDDSINGPWDMTSSDNDREAHLFVTNVLNGTVAAGGDVVNEGTVLRIDLHVSMAQMPKIESITVIGSGFSERTDPAALVIGPTGVGLSPACEDEDDGREGDDCANRNSERVLYVADSLNNRIAAIPNALRRTHSAGTGHTLFAGGSLNDPLGLTVAPNGHILVVNGDDGFITEIGRHGKQLATVLLDNTGGPPPGNGTLFGVTFDPERGVLFVDDGSNTLNSLN
ncbi:MAG TPA: hypothetical protein VFI60_03340 [Candidatus Acidoferrum sp.]|nr:hypothetical protein [Candidatus Acidoferrum sp.]